VHVYFSAVAHYNKTTSHWGGTNLVLYRNKSWGASFLVGQGRGSHIKLRDLGLYPGTRTLSAAGGLAGWGCRMAHWGGPGLEYDAGWASGAAAGPP